MATDRAQRDHAGEAVRGSSDGIKISVIIPVYNADKHLRACLDDLVRQTLRELEIICVDDGSDDCSRTILSDYAKRYKNFRFLQQEHAGAAHARNLGISEAKGKYLSILDCDDRFEHDMLERMYRRAEDTGADIVICGCDGFNNAGGRTVPMQWALDHSLLPRRDTFSVEDIPSRIFCVSYGWAWDKLFRADFIRQRGIRFQELPATNDMYFTFTALAEARSITVLRRVLVHQRLGREDSVSGTRHKNTDCFYYALMALRDRLIRSGLYEKTEQSFKNWAVSLSAWQLNTLTDHPEAFMELYGRLHDVILPALDIAGSKEIYYLRKNRKAYRQCIEIMGSTAEEYLYHRWQTAVKLKPRLLLTRTVGDDGLAELSPFFSPAARRVKGFFSSLRVYGAGYTAKMLLGMAFGRRK